MRIAGTANVVSSLTVVAWGYHVDSLASRPNPGKRSASMEPSPRMSELTANSSKTTNTTGVLPPISSWAPSASASASGAVVDEENKCENREDER